MPLAWSVLVSVVLFAQTPLHRSDPRAFSVKYVAGDIVYLDGGSAAGLIEGSRLSVKRPGPGESAIAARPFAEIVVVSVATASAACEIKSSQQPVEPGDIAYLSTEDALKVAETGAAKESEEYPQVITFTGADPIQEELRAEVPKPPLPEINRFRGRVDLEYGAIHDRAGSGNRYYQEGLAVRLEMTRIRGTYWSLNGYWRGLLNSTTGLAPQTLTDTMNRVYHIGLTYDSPRSRYVVGFGRLLLPWASSISTIDGGYFGRRFGKGMTIGTFAGSTPDPTAWNYSPHRQILGAFVSHEGGQMEGMRHISTAGVAVTRISWKPERQFAFVENSLSFRRKLSIYQNLEADYLSQGSFSSTQKMTLSRSFLTIRYQPVHRLSFDLSDNYFRVLPTFNTTLIASGLLDNLLFKGLSGGTRVELPFRVTAYASAGRSSSSTDTKSSWNTLYGATLAQTPWLHIRLDARHSRFTSAAGAGSYDALSLSREVANRWRFEVQGGRQNFQSIITGSSQSRFVIGSADYFLGRHTVFGLGATVYRGGLQNYDQIMANLGYRF